MTQHKIVKIPDWVTPESEDYLNQIGKDGWELVHLYNQHAYMKASAGGSLESGSLSPALDAFGRQRVSDVFTLGDYKHLYSINENFIDFTTASADIQHNVNQSLVVVS